MRHAEGEFKPGDVIENHLVVAGVKRGGMGIVYLCYDNALERPVAVKTFQDKYLANEKGRRQFIEEGRTWAKLMRHPNIVECYSAFESFEGRPYLNLEYVEGVEDIGVSLRDWITKKRLDFINIIDFAIQICTAMQYAQNVLPGFVHCDLKPENILITSNRKVKVTDFGLAKVVDNDVTQNNRVGTYFYMSPEQVKSLDLDERSDIYAFGCILYEMLTGRMVFAVSSVEEYLRCHVKVEPVSPSAIVSLPAELDKLVMRCLKKHRHRRPTTFGEIAEMLMSISEQYTGRKKYNAEVASLKGYELANKAIALHRLGYIEEGLGLLSKAMQEFDSPGNWLLRGTMLHDLGRYQEAFEALDLFLSFDPDDSNAVAGWINRGNCLDYLGRPDEALKSYNKALEIDNKSYEAWLNKAATLKRIGRVDEAQKYIDDYLKIDPRDRDFLYAKACILNDQQQYQEAIEYFNRALEIDPLFSDALNDEGAAFFSLGKWREALACFDRLVKIDKLDARAWYNRGLALRDLGQIEEAIASFDHTLALNPDYPDVRKIKDEVVRRFSSQ
jgi:tetratricopeptide (TPR) repeat protein